MVLLPITVLTQALQRHLLTHHKQVPVAQRQLLVQHCQALEGLITRPKDLQLPRDGSRPLPFLEVLKGFSCTQPGYHFLSASRRQIRRHANQVHDLTLQACTNSY
jgi:hypothetical protein